jgi:hypothetical protein
MRSAGNVARTGGEEEYIQYFGVNSRGKEATRKT